MSRRNFLAALPLILACICPSAMSASADSGDVLAVQKIMKATWDKPEAPLKVEPVVIAGNYALAGWMQAEAGGRALLRREHGNWKVIVCGGDGLLKADALAQTGMPSRLAQTLARSAAAAERKLSPAVRKQLSLFDGIVRVDGAHGPEVARNGAGHDAHHGKATPAAAHQTR